MTDLKLIALDEEDLQIFSAHLQDAVARAADMAFLPRENRFVVILNRFDWHTAEKSDGLRSFMRKRSALRFEKVISARVQNFAPGRKAQVVALLAIQFEPVEPPGGFVTLVFAGNSAIRLEVECIEAELQDLGAAWRTALKPQHPEKDMAQPAPGSGGDEPA